MNNPLDTNAFTHYLRFISLGRTDLYEICEPIFFDAANFIQKQENKRYSRSIEYGAINKLSFVDANGIALSTPKVVNPQGDIFNHLDYGLQWLLYIYKNYGFQSKVEYILEKNGLQFSGGMLDFTDKEVTDNYSYVACKLIQKNKVADLKRQLDSKFNLFGTVDAKNNTITPATTIDFLRKAQPLNQSSKWSLPETKTFLISDDDSVIGSERRVYNFLNRVDTYGINDTLSFLQDNVRVANDSQAETVANDFIYLRFQNDISNGVLTFKDINLQFTPIANVLTYDVKIYYAFSVDSVFDYSAKQLLYSGTEPTSVSVNQTFSNIFQERSNSLHFWIETTLQKTAVVAPAVLQVVWNSGEITMDLTETAIDTVTKGVRWIDAIKQGSKFACGLPVDASLFDVGGIHYNNVIFNRNGISGKTDNFTATAKLLLESIEEVNCDYEPNENGIYIGHQTDFYENVEIARFDVIPDESFSIEENDRCQINKHIYKYKTFQQDRTVKGTGDAIHTDSEWRIFNDNVENVKEVSLDFVRDSLTHQATVDLEIAQPSTSTNDDDKINIVEITSLAPSSFNEFSARLLMRITNGKLEILNRDSQNNSDVVINWEILGFSVGSSFQITYGENIGSYTVFAITPSVLTLTPIAFTPTFNGDAFIRVKYFYTNVLWVTRTDEGFISNPLNLQNVRYSIKRNMTNYFGEYYAGCLMYEKKDIVNGYFKSNGGYTSQMAGEASPVTENATILYSSLPNPLITPKIYNITCFAEFEDILNYLEAYKVNRGFIRTFDSQGKVIKGFIQSLDHLWQENRLKLVIEEKFETEYLILTFANGILTVNDAPYNLSGVSDWWRFDNDFIKLYDADSKPLSNYYKYDLVELNGVIYPTKADLVTALVNLI